MENRQPPCLISTFDLVPPLVTGPSRWGFFFLPYSTSVVVSYLLDREGFPVLALTPAATNERLLGSFFSDFQDSAVSAKLPSS